MPWVKIKGVEGLVFEPEEQPASEKKHNCPDCFCCQWCPDERCAQCLKRKKSRRRKKR